MRQASAPRNKSSPQNDEKNAARRRYFYVLDKARVTTEGVSNNRGIINRMLASGASKHYLTC